MVLISPGTKLCLVGKTSSGKSTLLREICEECTDIFTETPTVVYFVYQHRQDFFIPLQRKLADQICVGNFCLFLLAVGDHGLGKNVLNERLRGLLDHIFLGLNRVV